MTQTQIFLSTCSYPLIWLEGNSMEITFEFPPLFPGKQTNVRTHPRDGRKKKHLSPFRIPDHY
jgi:hypothetical protein